MVRTRRHERLDGTQRAHFVILVNGLKPLTVSMALHDLHERACESIRANEAAGTSDLVHV